MKEKSTKFRYLSVYEDIKTKIEDGEFAQGERLKTEKELQDKYSVSRDTIRKALGKLESEDYIIKKPAVGTFVKYMKSDYPLTSLESFTEQMRKRGVKPSSELLSIELSVIQDKLVSRSLNLEAKDKCYKITRVRKGNGKPMAYEIAYVPRKLCPDMQKYLDDNTSLYDVYESTYHLKLGVGNICLEADLPSVDVQEALGINHDSPVLKMKCVTLLEDGTPLYYVDCYYIGEKYFFSATMRR